MSEKSKRYRAKKPKPTTGQLALCSAPRYIPILMACLALPPRDTSAFDELLAAHPELHRVSFYCLTCKSHGVFRLLANGVIPRCCPRCSQPAKLLRVQDIICATRRPVPLVQRWRADNHDRTMNTPPAWLRRLGEIEDCQPSSR